MESLVSGCNIVERDRVCDHKTRIDFTWRSLLRIHSGYLEAGIEFCPLTAPGG